MCNNCMYARVPGSHPASAAAIVGMCSRVVPSTDNHPASQVDSRQHQHKPQTTTTPQARQVCPAHPPHGKHPHSATTYSTKSPFTVKTRGGCCTVQRHSPWLSKGADQARTAHTTQSKYYKQVTALHPQPRLHARELHPVGAYACVHMMAVAPPCKAYNTWHVLPVLPLLSEVACSG